jgi:hypothetical protein
MSNILGVNIHAPLQAMIHSPLTDDGHKMMYAPGLQATLARLAEESVDSGQILTIWLHLGDTIV